MTGDVYNPNHPGIIEDEWRKAQINAHPPFLLFGKRIRITTGKKPYQLRFAMINMSGRPDHHRQYMGTRCGIMSPWGLIETCHE